ncbi:hypothetical protein M2405_006121 [Rhodococcus erythropolis]|uniref:hypothetical protein n=1 Tax=Rhodococcus erythropolis TaxID=1833 RepID=UPI00216AA43B|nr:hypothetical protein [Rhodococcus erythropolis]MCS4257794.1 hypothetical protein [Rhodococcus erythropolis]MCW2425095.1 hypothetical protein [Rhodococcus erythropolis]
MWLRLDKTSIPHYEISHGQVTFYNAKYLAAFVDNDDPTIELEQCFKVIPREVLKTPWYAHVPDDETEWEPEWHMAYARVQLTAVPLHEAEQHARTLVRSIIAVHHPDTGTWEMRDGHLLYVNGTRRGPMTFGPRRPYVPEFSPRGDSTARYIEAMKSSSRHITSESVGLLQDALKLSQAIKDANDAESRVLASVRAVEHANAWATGGRSTWDQFASRYFKKAAARVRAVEKIGNWVPNALHGVPDRRPSARKPAALIELQRELNVSVLPDGNYVKLDASLDHVATLCDIYADHWTIRPLTEIKDATESGEHAHRNLLDFCETFEAHLSRLRRLRNAAIHGGPITTTACESVSTFAYNLGHQILNEVMLAVLTGVPIDEHIDAYRQDHVQRYADIEHRGDLSRLFKPAYAIDNTRAEANDVQSEPSRPTTTNPEGTQEESK